MTGSQWALIGVLATGLVCQPARATAQDAPVFRAAIDAVRISATVRDRKGRFVANLAAKDFEVLDDGQPREALDLQHELTGVSIALLFDISGSMESNLAGAREAAAHLLSR